MQFSGPQNWATQKVINSLSARLNTTIALDRIDIEFVKTISLKGFYIEDQEQDTLLYAKHLKASIGLFSLFGKKIQINQVALKGISGNIKRSDSGDFNFDFIPAAFRDTTSIKDSTKVAWEFGIDHIALENAQLNYQDLKNRQNIATTVGELTLAVEKMDLEKLDFEIGPSSLNNSRFNYSKVTPIAITDSTRQIDRNLSFPKLPFQLVVEQFDLRNNQFDFKILNEKNVVTNTYELSGDSWELDDVILTDKNIAAEINLIKTNYNQLPGVEKLSVDLLFTPQLIQLDNIHLTTGSTIIKNSLELAYEDLNALVKTRQFKQLNFQFNENQIASNDLIAYAPLFLSPTSIKNLPRNKMIQLQGQIQGDHQKLSLENIDFDLGEKNDLKLSGYIQNYLSKPKIDISLDLLEVNHKGIKYWLPDSLNIPDFSHLGQVVASGQIKGTLDDIILESFNLKTEANTNANGNFQFFNLSNINNLHYVATDVSLTSNAIDLQPLLSDSLSHILYNLEDFGYTGNIQGTLKTFDIDGKLLSKPGALEAKLNIEFDKNYRNATYAGKVALDQFDLGELLNDTLIFGNLTLDIMAEGEGLSPADLKASVAGTVASFEFNNYLYSDLNIDGNFNGYRFTGNFDIEDPNIALDFEGQANLNPKDLSTNLVLNVDTIDFQALNFMDNPLALSAGIRSNFSGSNIDQLLGTLNITNLELSNGIQKYQDSQIQLTAKNVEEGKSLSIISEVLDFDITGDYKILDLPDLFKSYLNDYFPIVNLSEKSDQQALFSEHPNPQKFDFNLNLKNVEEISAVFLPSKIELDPFSAFTGKIDTKNRIMEVDLKLLDIVYDGNFIDSLNINLNGESSQLEARMEVINLKNEGLANFPRATLDAVFKDQQANFDIDIRDGNSALLVWSGQATSENNISEFVFGSNLTISDKSWNVNEENLFRLGNGEMSLSNFMLSKDKQQLAVEMNRIKSGEPLDIDVDFLNIELQEFSEILNNPDLAFRGTLTGTANANDVLNNLKLNADIRVADLFLNDTRLGVFTGIVEQHSSDSPLDIDLRFSEGNDATITGIYDLSGGDINLLANINSISLVIIEPFISEFIDDSKGGFNGNITVKGNMSKPSINGVITTRDMSTKLVLTGARYFSNDGTISLSNQDILFSNFILNDKEGNAATLTGAINHNFFTDFYLDLNLSTDRIRILNTTREDNSLYSGSIFTKASASIKGPTDLMNIVVEAKTLDGTNIEIQPLYDDLSVAQEDYIIFGNPNELLIADSFNTPIYNIGSSGFNLTLNLDVTQSAALSIVIDPLTGDQMDARGNGDLLVKMDPSGAVNMLGTYQLVEGIYNFSYENLVKRKFTLDPSSTLVFVGDPLDTQFDIQAKYTTNVSPLPLIENEAAALSEAEITIGKRKVPTSVIMKIKGDLEAPEFIFDLDISETVSGNINQLVTQKLANLRSDPSSLNKQVFGLLLFNNFILENSNANIAQAPVNQVYNSISALVSNQLNRLAGKYFSGVNLELGFNTYNTGGSDNNNVSELNLQLSKQLFNDRLTIKVGGDFGLQNQTNSSISEGGYSSIAGNFVLEYKLNESGQYVVRVFHESDYEALLETSNNKTGVGIRFHKSY